MHFNFNISDPRWAITLAGTVNNAKTGPYKDLNIPFTESFESDNPLVKYLGTFFSSKPKDATDYKIPLEAQYSILDYFQAATHAKYLEDQHGIKQDPIIVPLYLNSLAQVSLLITHGVVSKPGYYFPKFSKNELANTPSSDALIEDQSYKEQAIAFCKGAGIANPVILSMADLKNDLEIAKCIFNTKLLVARPYHFSQYITRSQYKGYDFMKECIPVLSIIDSTVKQDDRFLVSWNGQLPCYIDEPLASLTQKGLAWKTRMIYNFDHREFLKAQAKQHGSK